jgi:hypothetical protein
MHFKEAGSESVDWIHLAQDRDQWRVLVKMEMNLPFHKILLKIYPAPWS